MDFFGLTETGDSKSFELEQLSQHSEDMCSRVFDFTAGETDNGWIISNDKSPFKAVRNSDGKEFIVGIGDGNVTENVTKKEESVGFVPIEIAQDVKRFNSIVSESELDSSKYKRSVSLICYQFNLFIPALVIVTDIPKFSRL